MKWKHKSNFETQINQKQNNKTSDKHVIYDSPKATAISYYV